MAEDPQQSEAYRAGKAAAEAREPHSRNPHPPGSPEHEAWQAGFAAVTAPDEIADDIADFA